MDKITKQTVQADFNDPLAVVTYTRAAHRIGLWRSERAVFATWLPRKDARILEAGCGAGRVTVGLWEEGYTRLTAFDFAEELVEQARCLAEERGAGTIRFLVADATRLSQDMPPVAEPFDAVLFMFNGLMQIPGRDQRRLALSELARVALPHAPFVFTTHDREASPVERSLWRHEALAWAAGTQDPRLVEFGDRYFEDEAGRTFMHLPVRSEIIEDLEASGWEPVFDTMRRQLAAETRQVRDFSDECRFWVARRRP